MVALEVAGVSERLERLLDWINGDRTLPPDDVVEHFTALFTAAAYAAAAPTTATGASVTRPSRPARPCRAAPAGAR